MVFHRGETPDPSSSRHHSEVLHMQWGGGAHHLNYLQAFEGVNTALYQYFLLLFMFILFYHLTLLAVELFTFLVPSFLSFKI